jgi:hypothetical protein
VFQDKVDTTSPVHICSHSPSKLANIILTHFGEMGTAMCCREDGCNRDIPAHFRDDGPNKDYLFKEDLDQDLGGAGGGNGGKPGELTSDKNNAVTPSARQFSIVTVMMMAMTVMVGFRN